MSEQEEKPFVRTTMVDERPLVGAKWWNESVAGSSTEPADSQRRSALIAIGVLGLLMFAPVCMCSRCGGSSSSDDEEKAQKSLELQRNFGWSFGGEEQPLVFDGTSLAPYDPTTLATLAAAVEPKTRFKADHRRTLFEATDAAPKLARPADAPVFVPLRTVMRPHLNASMEASYKRGRALASLFETTPGDDVLLVIDLPGPDAVAFAAGLAQLAEPVFTFDNWPHPLGVVPAHQTLSAVVYYRPLFEKASSGARKMTAFVLDRNRLLPYTDDGAKFDNRYVARLPAASALTSANTKHVLYVSPAGSEVQERDDLNDDFVGYERAGIDVRVVGADEFVVGPGGTAALGPPGSTPTSSGDDTFYGGSSDSHYSFWGVYGWRRTTRRYTQPAYPSPSSRYRVTPRATPFVGVSSGKTTPPTFGSSRVYVSRSSGGVTAPSFGRSGSYGRSSGSWGS
jgi:hypothetical protein